MYEFPIIPFILLVLTGWLFTGVAFWFYGLSQKDNESDEPFRRELLWVRAEMHDCAREAANLLLALERMEQHLPKTEKSNRLIDIGRRSANIIYEMAIQTKERIKNNTPPVPRRWINMVTLCEEIRDTFTHKAQVEGVAIEVAKPRHAQLPNVLGDKYALRPALDNLVDNGIKYADHSKADPRVVMELYADETQLHLEVWDNGLGIPSEHLSYLFDPTYRSQQNEKRDIPGDGMGLYRTRLLIEEHDGTIDVHSCPGGPGKVTTFHIRLPFSETTG